MKTEALTPSGLADLRRAAKEAGAVLRRAFAHLRAPNADALRTG
jgi:hypothetical protein